MSLPGNDAFKQQNTFNSAPKRKKKFKIDIRNMGVNIDKNEYYEIKLSNSAHPERGL